MQFFSASSSEVDSKKAIKECMEKSLGGNSNGSCRLLIIHSSIGHDFEQLLSEAGRLAKGAEIVGCTGSGVLGKEGPNEAMRALAVMACSGEDKDFTVAAAEPFPPERSFDVGVRIAKELKQKNPGIHLILFYPSGLNIMPAEALKGIESVAGPEVTVFGGLSFDNLKFLTSYQFFGTRLIEKGACAVGIADPSIEAVTAANHSFQALEPPFTVTKSAPGLIQELDGEPTWKAVTGRVGMPEDTPFAQFTMVFSGFGWELPEAYREEYGSRYISFTGIPMVTEEGAVLTSTPLPEGEKIWLLKREEKPIFEGAGHLTGVLKKKLDGRRPKAVFQADCAYRGKMMLDRIAKDEYFSLVKGPLTGGNDVPWLGLYGAGEYAQIKGRNFAHVFTTSLCAIVDR